MENMSGDLSPVLEQIERDKGIKKEELIKLIEQSLVSTFKKHNSKFTDVKAKIDLDAGVIQLFVTKIVVKKVTDPTREVDLTEAKEVKKNAQIDDVLQVQIDTESFGRIAAQTAKQVIIQKMREIEKDNLFKEYKSKEGTIINGIISRMANETAIIDLGKTKAVLPRSEQIENENYSQGAYIKAYIVKVEEDPKGPKILMSRKHPGFLQKLFELEIPEVYDGTIDIKGISRDPGNKAKVAVYSRNPKVDPVGSCVGLRGSRVKSIIDELNGEKIDLVLYSDDIKIYIENAIKPAQIDAIYLDPISKNAEIIMAEDQLSLAIGKKGVNIKLAARLIGWHLEVTTEARRKEAREAKLETVLKDFEQLEGVSEKMANILINAGYSSLEILKNVSKEDLMGLQGIGEKTAATIMKAVKKIYKK